MYHYEKVIVVIVLVLAMVPSAGVVTSSFFPVSLKLLVSKVEILNEQQIDCEPG
jgi:hypothetical protein